MSYSPCALVTFTFTRLPPGTMIESPGWLKPSLPALTSGVVGSCSSPVCGLTAPWSTAIFPQTPLGEKQLLSFLTVVGTWLFFTKENVWVSLDVSTMVTVPPFLMLIRSSLKRSPSWMYRLGLNVVLETIFCVTAAGGAAAKAGTATAAATRATTTASPARAYLRRDI